jgi:hypothetical protein
MLKATTGVPNVTDRQIHRGDSNRPRPPNTRPAGARRSDVRPQWVGDVVADHLGASSDQPRRIHAASPTYFFAPVLTCPTSPPPRAVMPATSQPAGVGQKTALREPTSSGTWRTFHAACPLLTRTT